MVIIMEVFMVVKVPVLDGRVHHLRASQREKHGGGGHEHHHMMAGEWTNLHATRV